MYDLEPVARAICHAKNYAFVRGIGKGSFKETFFINNESAEEEALKVFKEGRLNAERITREIDAMVRCRHPNVVNLKEVSTFEFNHKTYLYLIEEFLAGGTLTERIKSGGLSDKDIIEMGSMLIDAIAHIASHNLVHRDIKPDNILFRADKITPVLVDFGVVRDLSEYSLTPSWAMSGPGTPFFAAPEQLNNEKDLIDWRTDQFSLGIVLSFCILGQHPYKYPNDTSEDTINRVLRRESLYPDMIHKLTIRGFQTLIVMSSPWPVERYRTPVQLLKAWSELKGVVQ